MTVTMTTIVILPARAVIPSLCTKPRTLNPKPIHTHDDIDYAIVSVPAGVDLPSPDEKDSKLFEDVCYKGFL